MSRRSRPRWRPSPGSWILLALALPACQRPPRTGTDAGTSEYCGGVLQGRELLAVHPLTAGEARGRWHWRLTREGGRVVRATHLTPSGLVEQEMRLSYDASGNRSVVQSNEHGVVTSQSRYRPDGRAARLTRAQVAELDGCHHRQFTYDEAGRPVERLCLDASDLAVIDESGCQLWRSTFDALNQRVNVRCLSTDRHGRPLAPVLDDEGVHEARLTYNAMGYVRERHFFDLAGAPTGRRLDSCLGVRFETDATGSSRGWTCLGPGGQPQAERGSTVASTRHEVDANGCTVQTSYADAAGQPTPRGDLALVTLQVTPQCEVLEREQHRADGSLLAWPQRIARWNYRYDEAGQRVAMACFDGQGAPTGCSGFTTRNGAVRTFAYDERGREVLQRSLLANQHPSDSGDGYPHVIESHYGPDGRVDERRFFDAQGQPATALGNVGLQRYHYNALGHVVRHDSFGVDGRPIVPSTGCHAIARTYNESGHVVRITCASPDSRPQPSHDLRFAGVSWPDQSASVEIKRGEHPTNTFLDPSGREMTRVDCTAPEAACYR